MDRRSFLKKTALGAAGFAVPTILPSGSLFAATGNRRANHVVFVLFSGGVRTLESIFQQEGNLMPNMLKGNAPISSGISGGIDPMPSSPLGKTLQESGTLYTNFKFAEGPTGHFNGHTSAITGQHTNYNLSLRTNPPYPTVFELYRKHNSPVHAAKNAWWISHSNALYPLLDHSSHPDYGLAFAANQIAPNPFFQFDISFNLRHELEFTADKWEVLQDLRTFMNSNFRSDYSLNNGVLNSPADRAVLQAWLKGMQDQAVTGGLNNPWGVPGWMNADQYNLYFAEELIKEFQPELLVVNLFDIDAGHREFTNYCNALHRADYGVAHLWNTIQNTPGMADDTVMIVMPEIGRNEIGNGIFDPYGREAIDHTNGDPMARDLFCLVVGPDTIVKQDYVDNSPGATVDVVPTIADILGFKQDIGVSLPGKVLESAFV